MSIEINGITKLYGTQRALDNVSFSVKKGELVGFLGPNGAGKSTLMKIICGYLEADKGKILLNHKLITPNSIELKNEIGYLPEHNPLYTDLFVKEYLEINAGFYKIKNRNKRIIDVVEMVGLGKEQHKKIGALSKGYRQRVGLAQALIHDPSILILDEPTTGLDPNQLEEIRGLITSISKEKTVILSTHIMQEVEAICKRVVIIDNGKIIANDEIEILRDGGNNHQQIIHIEFDKSIQQSQLTALPYVDFVSQITTRSFEIGTSSDEDIRPMLFEFAVNYNYVILSMFYKKHNLEKVFRTLTNK